MTPILFRLASVALACCVSINAQSFTAKVVGVVDGDTFDVLRNDQTTLRIRVAGIDAPESRQPWGRRAREAAASLVFGKVVILAPQGEHRGNPAYRPRLIARVTLPDGKDLGHELVAAGMAWHYRQYSNHLGLTAAEASARLNRRGLWQDSNPIPPWQWRHRNSPQ